MDLSRGASRGGRDVTESARAGCGREGGWQNIRTGARGVCSEAALDARKSGIFVYVLAFLMPVGCCALGYANLASKISGIRLFGVPKEVNSACIVDARNVPKRLAAKAAT